MLKPRGHVDRVSKYIPVRVDNVADVNSDSDKSLFGWASGFVESLCLGLRLDGAVDSLHSACELDQKAVAHRLDDPTPISLED